MPWDSDKETRLLPKELTFSCSNTFINISLLRKLCFSCQDEDGYEYEYKLTDLIDYPWLFKD